MPTKSQPIEIDSEGQLNRVGRSLVAFFCGLLATVAAVGYADHTSGRRVDRMVCAGPSFKSALARRQAENAGFSINERYNCVDRKSLALRNPERLAQSQGEAAATASSSDTQTLREARQGFATRVASMESRPTAVSDPPIDAFVRSNYKSGDDQVLSGFVTPNPNDGLRHPAIIWLSGGDINSLREIASVGSGSDDASLHAFRSAGVVVMLPTLRGSVQGPHGKEYFYGEVDDVLAAAEHLATLGYVNPERIYLGGEDTGATLALLTAEVSGRFAGVFSFGPAAQANHYPASLVPINFAELDPRELKLRSPIHWLHGIVTPTYIIESSQAAAGGANVESLCAKNANANVHCMLIADANHAHALARVATVAAARVAISDSRDFSMRSEEFQ